MQHRFHCEGRDIIIIIFRILFIILRILYSGRALDLASDEHSNQLLSA